MQTSLLMRAASGELRCALRCALRQDRATSLNRHDESAVVGPPAYILSMTVFD